MIKEVKLLPVYKNIITSPARIFICIGGRSAGRSFSVSAISTALLETESYYRCAIMRYILGDVRTSIWQEHVDRTYSFGLQKKFRIGEQQMSLKYNNNYIRAHGFKSASSQQKSKQKSLANYNTVIIEEGDEVDENSFRQLNDSVRTTEAKNRIIILTNPPPKSHFLVKRYLRLIPNTQYPGFYDYELKPEWIGQVELIKSTYKDNLANIDPQKVLEFETYGNPSHPNYDLYHYCTQILGLIAETQEGIIFPNWQLASEMPQDFHNESYGLDFGYTHPLVFTHNRKVNGVDSKENPTRPKLYSKELIYETGLTIDDVLELFIALDVSKTIPMLADNSRPEDIKKIKQAGYNIRAATKGEGSVMSGITRLKSYDLYFVDSPGLERDFGKYHFKKSSSGSTVDIPEKEFDDGPDSVRYGEQEFNTIAYKAKTKEELTKLLVKNT